ncbi:4-phosphopantetheinyl transferase family protein [Pedobacter frigiditerrae]|uniref:4-phosphopantetheinyl transferase family protein n=1 Tax=Pedobacter frigiditerrae TaxID=2530452 RepID=A0A4R0N3G5_9SPHI|nr:4'-phosphopantetheinyl transferase superfamily protein [Pedobacter frigiditerrae]TCC94408.1 4-phosphopantetheinyl transferase family protein [Pedobacter frigiditerrae]
MLGNDIVDLDKANTESDWKRKGYLDKLFSSQEQQEILNSSNPERMVWLFWSIKEAAYKIVNRETQERFYSPRKFNVTSIGNNGIVTFEGKTFYTKSEIKDNLIHTIAAAKAESLNHIQTSFLTNTSDYLSHFNSKSEHYTLEKDANGIPNLVDKINGESHFASISHHGRYLAVVYGVSL